MTKYTYIDETGRSVRSSNYYEAAVALYGQSLDGYSIWRSRPDGPIVGRPTTYVWTRSGYSEVEVYRAGDKIGSYWGVAVARPTRHTLIRIARGGGKSAQKGENND